MIFTSRLELYVFTLTLNEELKLKPKTTNQHLSDNDYLLGSKVQLYFIEMNSRYFICRAKRELIEVE